MNAGPFQTPRAVQVGTAETTSANTLQVSFLSNVKDGNTICVAVMTEDAGGASHTHTVPTGWTADVANQEQTDEFNTTSIMRYLAQPGDGTDFTFNISASVADIKLIAIEIEGVDQANPVMLSAQETQGSGAAGHTIDMTGEMDAEIAFVVGAANFKNLVNSTDWSNQDSGIYDLDNVEELVSAGGNGASVGYGAVNYALTNPDVRVEWSVTSKAASGAIIFRPARVFGFEEPKKLQHANGTSNNGESGSVELVSVPTVGAVLVAQIGGNNGSGTAGITIDTAGWTEVPGATLHPMVSQPRHFNLFLVKKVESASDNTIAWSETTSEGCAAILMEWSGIDVDNIVDQTETAEVDPANTSHSITSSTATEQDVELVIAGISTFGLTNVTGDSDWTDVDEVDTPAGGWTATTFAAYMIARTKSTYSMTVTTAASRSTALGLLTLRAKRQPYAKPVVVQSKANSTGNGTSVTTTLDDTPTVGNIMEAYFHAEAASPPDLTAAAGWTLVPGSQTDSGTNAWGSWYKAVTASDTGAVTFEATTSNMTLTLIERANVDLTDPVATMDTEIDTATTTPSITAAARPDRSMSAATVFVATNISSTFTSATDGFEEIQNISQTGSGFSMSSTVVGRTLTQADLVTCAVEVSASAGHGITLITWNAAPLTGFCDIVEVQSAETVVNTDTVTATFLSNLTEGNYVVAQVSHLRGDGAETISGYTDAYNLNYHGSGVSILAYKKIEAGDDPNDVVMTLSGGSGFSELAVVEYEGIDPTNPLMDHITTELDSSGTSAAFSGLKSTDAFKALLVAGFASTGGMGSSLSGGGFSTVEDHQGAPSNALVSRIITSNMSPDVTFSWTNSVEFGMGMTAFRPAASPVVRWQEYSDSTTSAVTTVSAVLRQTPTINNYVLAVYAVRKSSAFAITGPTGYTEIPDVSVDDFIDSGSNVGTLKAYYRKIEAGDSATVDLTTDVSVNWAYAIIEVSGVDFEGLTGISENEDSGATTLDELSVTPPTPQSYLLSFGTTADGSGVSGQAISAGFQQITETNIGDSNVPALWFFERIVNQ